jgi:predicted PurR-regulated permease PerM
MNPTTLQESPSADPPRTLAEARRLEEALFRALRRAILLATGLYLLYQFLGAVTLVVLLFLLVFIIAASLNPIVAWLQWRRIPRPVSAAAMGLLLLGGAAVALWLAVPPLLEEGQALVRQWPAFWDATRGRLERFLGHYPGVAAQIPTSQDVVRWIGPHTAALVGRVGRLSINLLGSIATLALLTVLVVYTLASPQPLVAGLLGALPERHRPEGERILQLVLSRLKSYALSSLLLGAIVGVMTGLGLHLLKVPFAFLFGVIAAIGELIPNLGPMLSAVPPILVALGTDPMLALWVALLFLVVQQLENNLIVPLVMSRTLSLHPLSISFMILAMTALSGLLGALIALPMTLVVKTLYEELYQRRQVSDRDTLEALSERVVSGEEPANEATGAAEVSPSAIQE